MLVDFAVGLFGAAMVGGSGRRAAVDAVEGGARWLAKRLIIIRSKAAFCTPLYLQHL